MDRKAMKQRAKTTFRRHYWLFIIVCLFAAFLGAQFGGSLWTAQAQDGTKSSVTVTTDAGEATVPGNVSGLTRLGADLLAGDEGAAERQVSDNESAIKADATNAALGRTRGVFASVLNAVSSGSVLLMFTNAIVSMAHSPNIAFLLMIVAAFAVAALFWAFIQQTYLVVARRIMLEARTYEEVPLRRFLYPIQTHRWTRIATAMALSYVFLMLWWFTIIGGIVKSFSYALVPYIMAENPNIAAREAITLSRRMMRGHKWEWFVARLTFLGWDLLGMITFGLSGLFYSNAYMSAFFAEYYVRLRSEAKEHGIEGAAQLSDDCLYAKPDPALLAETYADAAQAVAKVHAANVSKPTGFSGWLARWFGICLKKNDAVDAWDSHEAALDSIDKAEDIIRGRTYPGRLAPARMEFHWGARSNLNPQRSYTVLNLVAMFFIFCFAGWLWEVTLALITEGMFVNRGTLHGPWLPIYGTGGIVILLLLNKLRDKPVLLFAGTVVLCGCLEYFSSWFLEITHDGQRWWDYSGYFLNLNGRICAEGLLVFGLGGLAITYLLAPALDNLLSRLNRKALAAAAITLLVVYCADQAYSSVVPNTGAGITDYKGSSTSQGA